MEERNIHDEVYWTPEQQKAFESKKEVETMDELILKAIKALADNGGFNEIELSDRGLKVHLIRFTPVPCYYLPWPAQSHWPYNQP